MAQQEFEVDDREWAPPAGSEERQLWEMIALSHEAETFLDGRLARYMIDSAEMKVQAAKDQLATVSPDDKETIVKLQRLIKTFAHFKQSLRDIVTAGEAAYLEYQQAQADN